MARITIHLDDKLLAQVHRVAKAEGISPNQLIAEAIRRLRAKAEWPTSVRALAGAWPDFPTLDEIRKLV